jgi:hypothetical protein
MLNIADKLTSVLNRTACVHNRRRHSVGHGHQRCLYVVLCASDHCPQKMPRDILRNDRIVPCGFPAQPPFLCDATHCASDTRGSHIVRAACCTAEVVGHCEPDARLCRQLKLSLKHSTSNRSHHNRSSIRQDSDQLAAHIG